MKVFLIKFTTKSIELLFRFVASILRNGTSKFSVWVSSLELWYIFAYIVLMQGLDNFLVIKQCVPIEICNKKFYINCFDFLRRF